MKRTSASLNETDQQKKKVKRLVKAPETDVSLDDLLLGLIKAQLANNRHFGDIILQAVSRRFAALPVKRNFATSLELRGSDDGISQIFCCKVTLERHGTKVKRSTEGNLRQHLLKVFSFVKNFREIRFSTDTIDCEMEMHCRRLISQRLNAALLTEQRHPIQVRRLLLDAHWDPSNPLLNACDVLVDRASLRSITFDHVSFWHERDTSVAKRFLLAASTCANLRSVSLDSLICSAVNSARLDDLSDFLHRLPKLHYLKLGQTRSLSRAAVLRFSPPLTKCVSLKRLHLADLKWFDGLLQPAAIGLIGRLRSVIIGDSLFFTDSPVLNASIREKVTRISDALPSDACIAIDFSPNANFNRATTLPAVQSLLLPLLQFSRAVRRVVKLVDLDVSRETLRAAIESLPVDAFVGKKVLMEEKSLQRHLSLSDYQAKIVFTGLNGQ